MKKDFRFCTLVGGDPFYCSKGSMAAAEILVAITRGEQACGKLKQQSFYQGSDLYLICQAVEAVYAAGKEWEAADRQLLSLTGDELDETLTVYSEAPQATDSHRRWWKIHELENWAKTLDRSTEQGDALYRVYERWQQARKETVALADSVKRVHDRICWLSNAPEVETLTPEVLAPHRELRREQAKAAETLSETLMSGVAEALGLDAPSTLKEKERQPDRSPEMLTGGAPSARGALGLAAAGVATALLLRRRR